MVCQVGPEVPRYSIPAVFFFYGEYDNAAIIYMIIYIHLIGRCSWWLKQAVANHC